MSSLSIAFAPRQLSKRARRMPTLIGVLAILAIMLAACGNGSSSTTGGAGGTPKVGGTLNVGLNTDVTNL